MASLVEMTVQERRARRSDRRWRHVNIPLTAVATGLGLLLAEVAIAAFLLGEPLLLLAVAIIGDALFLLAVLRLRKTGNSVDDLLSTPAPSRR